jgi:hypothetical protein
LLYGVPRYVVGQRGFEPPTPCSQSRYANQAAPLPETHMMPGYRPTRPRDHSEWMVGRLVRDPTHWWLGFQSRYAPDSGRQAMPLPDTAGLPRATPEAIRQRLPAPAPRPAGRHGTQSRRVSSPQGTTQPSPFASLVLRPSKSSRSGSTQAMGFLSGPSAASSGSPPIGGHPAV